MDGVVLEAPAGKRTDRLMSCVVIAVYTLSAALPLSALDRVGLVLCPFRAITGLPCPGCGMTHAFVALGHGDLAGAWHYNALSFGVYAFGLLWLVETLTGMRAVSRLPVLVRGRFAVAALCVALAFGLYRIAVPAARPF